MPVVEPPVEVADREAVVDAGRVRAGLALGGGGLVLGIRPGSRVHIAGEQDGRAVGAPPGRAGAGGHLRHPLRLAAVHHVDYVNLRRLVVSAPGRERHAGAVLAPSHAVFAAGCAREPARGRTAVGRHDPQVAGLLLVVVGRFEHRHHGPGAVGADGRHAYPWHGPEIRMGDGPTGRLCAGTRREEGADDQQAGQDATSRQPHVAKVLPPSPAVTTGVRRMCR
jgi:hypothetical protein